MWSTAALAAEAAEEAPRTSMISAPRFATRGTNSSAAHAGSTTSSAGRQPPSTRTRAWVRSGNWVAEWLPQIVTPSTSVTATPARAASCATARLWSRRVRAVNRSAGTSGAWAAAISALVLAGLPTTTTRTSSAAWSLIARPWGPKIPPLASSRSPRSMPFVRGRAPTSIACWTPSNATAGSSVTSTSASRGNAASASSMAVPSAARRAAGISSRRSRTGVSGPSMPPAAMRNSRA